MRAALPSHAAFNNSTNGGGGGSDEDDDDASLTSTAHHTIHLFSLHCFPSLFSGAAAAEVIYI